MKQYGINNVRGGSYTRLYLSYNEVSILEKELSNSCDKIKADDTFNNKINILQTIKKYIFYCFIPKVHHETIPLLKQ